MTTNCDLIDPMLRTQFKRYAQFCIVGSTGVLVDMGTFYMLADPTRVGLNLTVTKLIAAEAALLNNFLWNDLWTFRELSSGRTVCRARWARFLRFNLICTVGIGLSVMILNMQVNSFRWNLYLANFIAIILVSVWNFLLNQRFGWGNVAIGGAKANNPRRKPDHRYTIMHKSDRDLHIWF